MAAAKRQAKRVARIPLSPGDYAYDAEGYRYGYAVEDGLLMVKYDPDVRFVAEGDRFLPDRFTVNVERRSLPHDVRLHFEAYEAMIYCMRIELLAYQTTRAPGPLALAAPASREYVELSTTALRELSVQQLKSDARHAGLHARPEVGDSLPELATWAEVYEDLGPQRQPRVSEADYRKTAEVYRTALHNGEPPRKAVAKHFHLSDAAAAKRISRARDRGYLGATKPGRKGEQ